MHDENSFVSKEEIMKTKLLWLFFLLLAVGCTKSKTDFDNIVVQQEAIFASKKEAVEKISQFLSEKKVDENLIDIENISYVHTPTRTIALVFYQSNTGLHNLAVERINNQQGGFKTESITVCDGELCACKVTARIENNGDVTIGCNCSSCEMITTQH